MILKYLRKQSGLTQKELAKLLGYEQTIVSMWENGTRDPNVQTLIELSKIFDCSIDELVGNEIIQARSKIKKNEFKRDEKFTDKQATLLPLIQMLNDRQCELTYDYLNNILDIAAAQQEKWGM